MSRCGAYIPLQKTPPAHWAPLRASGHLFAVAAGYTDGEVKLIESKSAVRSRVFGWDVYVKPAGAAKGNLIGTMLGRACDAFGPYNYGEVA